MTKKELAIANHDKKYNCCQAVACSFCKETGVDEETLFRAGEAFGLGMGGMEGTCGAISGAVMLTTERSQNKSRYLQAFQGNCETLRRKKRLYHMQGSQRRGYRKGAPHLSRLYRRCSGNCPGGPGAVNSCL